MAEQHVTCDHGSVKTFISCPENRLRTIRCAQCGRQWTEAGKPVRNRAAVGAGRMY